MASVDRYKIWCNTDSKWVLVWDTSEPTVCPENDGHSIDTSKTVIIESAHEEFPMSDIDGNKVAVHTSYKPTVPGSVTYAVWTGSGDDLTTSPPTLGGGDILDFNFSGSPLPTSITKDVKFAPEFGRIWIHEGYLKFDNAGHGDYVTADVVSYASPLQAVANKILYVEDNWVKAVPPGSPNGSPPIAGTHGWAGTPSLIPREFSKDGDWDYDGITLSPNYDGTGGFKISDIEQNIHRFFNKIPCCGSSPYFTMSSDETTELPAGTYLKIIATNNSGTAWGAQVLMELYRQQTIE